MTTTPSTSTHQLKQTKFDTFHKTDAIDQSQKTFIRLKESKTIIIAENQNLKDLVTKGKRKADQISSETQNTGFDSNNEDNLQFTMEIEVHKKKSRESDDPPQENAKEDQDNEATGYKNKETGKNVKTGNSLLIYI